MNGWDDDKLALAYEPDAADAADAAEWLQHVDDTYDCPHCGGEGETWITLADSEGQYLEGVMCPTCNGRGQLTAAQMSELYDRDDPDAEYSDWFSR